METYIIIGIIAVVVVAIGVYSILRNKKINENGIEADAVVSRIDTDTQTDADGSVSTNETYYVDYQNAEGEIVTAKLGKKNNRKKKQLVRIGCAALALAMTVGAVPFLMSHAAEGEAVTPIDIAAKNDVVSPADASARSITGTAEPNQYMTGIVESGSCGDGVTYTIDSEGTMVISGSGTIADHAFDCKDNFSCVVFADGSNITGIGIQAFGHCKKLSSFAFPENVTVIEADMFYECSGLTSVYIPRGVTQIGDSAFHGCTSLKSVDIPEGVTTIGKEAFSLSAVTTVTIPSTVTSIEIFAFERCKKLETVVFQKGVTDTGEYMFQECTALKNVTFPSTMKKIGYRAFSHCTSLTSLNLPDNLTTIGKDSFIGCIGLTSVTIPGRVTELGNGAFMDCKGLTSLTIEAGVPAIGSTAFQHCESLTSVTIPGSVKTINYDAFRSCFNMESVTISDGVKNIRNGAFWNCSRLTSLTIPDSVTTIERDTFRQCPGLTSVIIPDSVTSIGTDVLGECENLTSVTIPCGLTVTERNPVTLDENRKATDYFTNATVILSHNWEVSSTTATCTQSGIENLKCSVCGKKRTRDADALGHDWDEWKVTTYATCERKGEETRVCKHDATHTETREIAALGHRWGEWEVTKKPTDTEAGVETCTCQNDASHTQTRGVKFAFTSDAYQWTAGSKDGMTVIVKNVAEDGDDTTTFDRFRNVYVDGVALTKDKDYTAEPGSVKITLSAEYLQSLGTGVHTIRIELTVASLEQHPFTIVKPSSGPSSPATGESGMMTTFCMALMLIASYGVVFARKRKQTEQA